jgi:peptide/nickel transport system permease protein
VRSVVLTLREEPYVEAAVALGARTPALIVRHILPEHAHATDRAGNVRLRLRHPGGGDPELPRRRHPARDSDVGQHHGAGRALFRVFPHNIFFPASSSPFTVLAVNMLGDGLRDTLDPRVRKRL